MNDLDLAARNVLCQAVVLKRALDLLAEPSARAAAMLLVSSARKQMKDAVDVFEDEWKKAHNGQPFGGAGEFSVQWEWPA